MLRLRAGSIAWLVAWATLLLLCASGCAPARPEVTPRSQLELAARRAPSTRDQPLTIGFTAPTGQASTSSEPTIVFSKALRKLSDAATPPPPVTLEPQLAEGRWEWVGSRSVRFVHAKPLPNATRFAVRVPAGITAVDGTALAEGASWTFETPTPALARALHGPATGNASLDVELPLPASGERPPASLATDPIRVVFNQPVDLDALSASLRVSAKTKSGSAPVAFKLSAVPERPEEVVVRLEKAPGSATLKLELGELVSKEGPLRGAAVSLEARTRGPLEVLGLFCQPLPKAGEDPAAPPALVPATKTTQCALERPLELRLSNAVTQEALDAALQATPPLASAFVSGFRPDGSFAIELAPGYETSSGKLRLRLSGGMADDRGSKLASSYQATVTLASPVVRPEPEAYFGLRGRYGKLAPDGEVLVFGQRVTDVSAYAVPLSLEDSLFRKSDVAPPPPTASKLVQSLPASPGDEPAAHKVQLAKLFETMPVHGDVAFVVRYKDADTKELAHWVHVVTLTELAVFTRTSHGRARVWVLSAESGAPVQGAKVVVRSDQATSPTVETDAKGRADVDIPAQGTDFRVVVTKGDDTMHHAISARGGQDLGGVLDLFVDRGLSTGGDGPRQGHRAHHR
ncbi:MAG: hypothetical protein IPM79_21825 [Polyangiaceae bacterium]|nr:hypothetical protein [Polyangiaceae bacterium]